MKSELLQIEVELLLLKYGETSVLKVLSSATGSTEDVVRKKLATLKEEKAKPKPLRAKKQPIDIAKDVVAHSTNKDQLMRLAVSYQNQQFLPRLQDVRRFLGRFHVAKNIKSRCDATRSVFESLDLCSPKELDEFLSDLNITKQSSFAKLSGHIMGDRNSKHPTNEARKSD